MNQMNQKKKFKKVGNWNWLIYAVLLVLHSTLVFGIGYQIGAARQPQAERSIESLLNETRTKLLERQKQLARKGKQYGM